MVDVTDSAVRDQTQPEEPPKVSPFRSSAPFALIFTGLLVSVLGDSFYRVALTLHVAKHGALGLASLGVVLALPMAIVGLFAGALIDRSRPIYLLLGTDIARCVVVAGLGVLLLDRSTPLLAVLGMAMLLAFVSVLFTPTLQVLLPAMAGGDRDTLIAMDSWILGTLGIASVIGPAVAGVLVTTVGSTALIFFDAVTFAFSALMIFRAAPEIRAAEAQRRPKPREGKLAAISAGLKFLMRHPVLGPCFRTFPLMDFAFGSIPYVLPLLVSHGNHSRSALYGGEIAALAVGRVIGMTLINRTAAKQHRGTVLRVNFIGQALGLLLFVGLAGHWIGLVPLAVAGIPAGMAQVAMSSYVQTQVDVEMRGRVFTALISMVTWLAPLGPVVFLSLAAATSPHVALLAIALILLCGGLRLWWCRPLARVE